MRIADLRVQRCGCMAVPEELASGLGMRPGATISADLNAEHGTVTLWLSKPAPDSTDISYAACTLEP